MSIPDKPIVAKVAVAPFVIGETVSGSIQGLPDHQNKGLLTLGIVTKAEWERAQKQKRDPIPDETYLLNLDTKDGNRFQFTTTPEMVGPFVIYTIRGEHVKIAPTSAMARRGAPDDRAGPQDRVSTAGMGGG